jgi:hypothetical protein
MTAGVWIAIVSGAGGLLLGGAALLKALLERPKVRADAMKLITDAAASTVTSIAEQLQDARREGVKTGQLLERMEAQQKATAELLDQTHDQLDEAKRWIARLNSYQRRVGRWWERHMPWDQGMQEIARESDPAAVKALPALEPFPVWDENG